MNLKMAIYTANIGDYDDFKDPKIIDPSVDYILFTDNKKFKSKIWKVININSLNELNLIKDKLDNRKIARFIKINSHICLPDYDFSMWVDSSFELKIENLLSHINEMSLNDNQIMCYKHHSRSCLYDEAKVCMNQKLDYENVIQSQILKYKNNNFPQKRGLFSTGIIFRKNNKNIELLNNIWWNEVFNGSCRDQLSQTYASWASNVNISEIKIGDSVYSNLFVSKKTAHKGKRTYSTT